MNSTLPLAPQIGDSTTQWPVFAQNFNNNLR